MPANKINWVVFYTSGSQIYGTATKQIALETPPPPGVPIEDKRILFITYQPDNEILSVHPLPQEEVLSAELKYPKKKDEDAEA
ncbi:MAG TPA: hypothetical protein VJ742_12085 [Nitrososphaera sp.]|nr:hypothetical protein [Nitrososphaera sp.]